MSHLRRAIEPDRGPRAQAEILRTQLPGYRLVLPRRRRARRRALPRANCSRPARAAAGRRPGRGRSAGDGRSADLVGYAVRRRDRRGVRPRGGRPPGRGADRGPADPLRGGRRDRPATPRCSASWRPWPAAQPFDETVARLLVVALHRSGRTADALARHRGFVATLADDLGPRPEPGLRRAPGAGAPAGSRAARAATGTAVPVATAPGDLPRRRPPIRRGRGDHPRSARPSSQVIDRVVGDRGGRPIRRRCCSADRPASASRRWPANSVGGPGRAGVAVGIGRCHEDADVTALWPVQSALAELGAPLRRRRRRDGGGPARTGRAAAGVLIIEDVHWAGAETLRLIGFLAVELASAPITLVLTSRPERSPGLVGLLATLARQPGFARLELDELTVGDARAVAERAGDGLSAADLDLVVERAGGNPFFVAETARLVAAGDREGLPGGCGRWSNAGCSRCPMPTRTVLLAAAVLGQRFDLALLAGVLAPRAARPEITEELLDALQQAVDLAMLDRGGPGRRTGLQSRSGPRCRARRRRHPDPSALAPAGRAGAAAPTPPGPTRWPWPITCVEGLPLTDRAAAIAAAVAAGRGQCRHPEPRHRRVLVRPGRWTSCPPTTATGDSIC